MGTNRRYADRVDARMNDRIVEVVMRDHSPDTLTPAELELDELPLSRAPKPRRVRAWVRYGNTPLNVDAEAVAWTVRAVAVRWRTPAGEEHRAWVWAGAVTPRD